MENFLKNDSIKIMFWTSISKNILTKDEKVEFSNTFTIRDSVSQNLYINLIVCLILLAACYDE